MNLHVVIDTNILVSALYKRNSVPDKVVNHALNGKIISLFDENIFAEYDSVLHRPKFHFSQEDIEEMFRGILERGEYVEAKDFEFKFDDPKDKIFYCVLMTAREEVDAYLVTGNLKHFPQEIFIVTPRELLNIIERDGD